MAAYTSGVAVVTDIGIDLMKEHLDKNAGDYIIDILDLPLTLQDIVPIKPR